VIWAWLTRLFAYFAGRKAGEAESQAASTSAMVQREATDDEVARTDDATVRDELHGWAGRPVP
jgi:hypothetical protein